MSVLCPCASLCVRLCVWVAGKLEEAHSFGRYSVHITHTMWAVSFWGRLSLALRPCSRAWSVRRVASIGWWLWMASLWYAWLSLWIFADCIRAALVNGSGKCWNIHMHVCACFAPSIVRACVCVHVCMNATRWMYYSSSLVCFTLMELAHTPIHRPVFPIPIQAKNKLRGALTWAQHLSHSDRSRNSFVQCTCRPYTRCIRLRLKSTFGTHSGDGDGDDVRCTHTHTSSSTPNMERMNYSLLVAFHCVCVCSLCSYFITAIGLSTKLCMNLW